jgi:hypothetical protein
MMRSCFVPVFSKLPGSEQSLALMCADGRVSGTATAAT